MADFTDGAGYVVRPQDLVFLAIPPEQYNAAVRRESPLGINPQSFPAFCGSLRRALVLDGVIDHAEGLHSGPDAAPIDVRLQGSASNFFSGPHKTMPKSRTHVFDAMVRSTPSRALPLHRVDVILSMISRQWPDGGPTRRPFDSFLRLGIENIPSDLDLQFSSSDMVDKIIKFLIAENLDPSELKIKNDRYQFVRREFAETVFAHVSLWALRWAEDIGRPVTWALFDSQGPPQTGDPSSSHFKNSDWRLSI